MLQLLQFKQGPRHKAALSGPSIVCLLGTLQPVSEEREVFSPFAAAAAPGVGQEPVPMQIPCSTWLDRFEACQPVDCVQFGWTNSF